MINTTGNVLFAVMITIIFFGIIHLVFSLGRVYECLVVIREIDEKIDREMKEMKKINEEIKKLELELKQLEGEQQ